MVHSLILRIYIKWALILGSAEVLIIDQCSSGLFNCDIAMSKIFECRPVKNRTMRYTAICVLSGNVACQSAMKSVATRAFLPPHKTKISTVQFDLEAVDNVLLLPFFIDREEVKVHKKGQKERSQYSVIMVKNAYTFSGIHLHFHPTSWIFAA